jgi:AcrR family transcriptional regulator
VPTTTELLWRHEVPLPPRPGRRPRFSVDDIVAAAIEVADSAGAAFALRDVASSLGVGVMSLYSYVDDREQLLDLMIDECHRTLASSAGASGTDWAVDLRSVAADNLTLMRAHPWLADHGGERAALGPGTIAKYERELAVFEPLPISDLEKDACLTLLVDFVKAAARSMALASNEQARETHDQWWAREGAALQRIDIANRFPVASRVGQAAGAHHGAAGDTSFAYAFGLDRLVAGVTALIESNASNSSSRSGPSRRRPAPVRRRRPG